MVVINIKHKNIQIVVIKNKINTIPSAPFLALSNTPHMIDAGLLGYLECLYQTHFLLPCLDFLIYKWI